MILLFDTCFGSYIFSLYCCQVAPYERPALSKGYLLPEGDIHMSFIIRHSKEYNILFTFCC